MIFSFPLSIYVNMDFLFSPIFQMQQLELAQMQYRDANLTALAAIGPRKKRLLETGNEVLIIVLVIFFNVQKVSKKEKTRGVEIVYLALLAAKLFLKFFFDSFIKQILPVFLTRFLHTLLFFLVTIPRYAEYHHFHLQTFIFSVCVSERERTPVKIDDYSGQSVSDLLELELHVVLSHLRWVLEIELGSSARAVCTLKD